MNSIKNRDIINILKSTPANKVYDIMEMIDLPNEMKKIIYLRFCKRNPIKIVSNKLYLSNQQIIRRTRKAIELIVKSNIF